MTDERPAATEGGCTCGTVRYRMKAKPIVVHCCHCSWCQRETGSAFAVNAFVEASEVEILKGRPVPTTLPSLSGKGQVLWRCPDCGVTMWSNYASAGPKFNFVRVGTLDDPSRVPPDDAPAVPEFYNPSDLWSAEGLARFKAAKEG
jgi:hypothetical protein